MPRHRCERRAHLEHTGQKDLLILRRGSGPASPPHLLQDLPRSQAEEALSGSSLCSSSLSPFYSKSSRELTGPRAPRLTHTKNGSRCHYCKDFHISSSSPSRHSHSPNTPIETAPASLTCGELHHAHHTTEPHHKYICTHVPSGLVFLL